MNKRFRLKVFEKCSTSPNVHCRPSRTLMQRTPRRHWTMSCIHVLDAEPDTASPLVPDILFTVHSRYITMATATMLIVNANCHDRERKRKFIYINRYIFKSKREDALSNDTHNQRNQEEEESRRFSIEETKLMTLGVSLAAVKGGGKDWRQCRNEVAYGDIPHSLILIFVEYLQHDISHLISFEGHPTDGCHKDVVDNHTDNDGACGLLGNTE